MKNIDMIWTNPGGDCMNEMNISFHSIHKEAILEYSKDGFNNIISINSIGVYTPKEYIGNNNYYHHSIVLSNLDSNTIYKYRIKTNNEISEIHSFKTSNDDYNFSFALIGDVHSVPGDDDKIKMIDTYVNKSNELSNGIDFVLGYGDMILNGINYSHWEEWNKCNVLKHYMYAPITGNKEYYDEDGHRTTNLWFTSMFNCPKNGVIGLESTYYFIYNHVLFIALDCVSHEGKEMEGEYCLLESQQKWFEEVMEENIGKYEYSIVFRHYPFFSTKEADTDGAHKVWGKYEEWAPLFDKYDIDLEINGDNHSYASSKRLYNDEVSNDYKKGTYYVTAPEIIANPFEMKLELATNHLMSKHQRGGSAGSMYTCVNKKELTLYLLGSDNNGEIKVFDSIVIRNKNK